MFERAIKDYSDRNAVKIEVLDGLQLMEPAGKSVRARYKQGCPAIDGALTIRILTEEDQLYGQICVVRFGKNGQSYKEVFLSDDFLTEEDPAETFAFYDDAAVLAETIQGPFFYATEYWVDPKYRGEKKVQNLTDAIPIVARCAAVNRWGARPYTTQYNIRFAFNGLLDDVMRPTRHAFLVWHRKNQKSYRYLLGETDASDLLIQYDHFVNRATRAHSLSR